MIMMTVLMDMYIGFLQQEHIVFIAGLKNGATAMQD